MKGKPEDNGYRCSFFRFIMFLTKTKIVVSVKVEKYKMITVTLALLPMKSYVGQMKGLTMPREKIC